MKILQAQALSALFHKSNKNKSFGFPCCVRKTRTFKNWITELIPFWPNIYIKLVLKTVIEK